MRVLLITNDYPPRPGGIQQYLSNLVKRSSAGFRVLAPDHPGAPAEPGVVRSRWKFMWPTSRVREWIGSQIEEFEPDVLLFGAPHPLAQLGPRLGRTFGLPYVWSGSAQPAPRCWGPGWTWTCFAHELAPPTATGR